MLSLPNRLLAYNIARAERFLPQADPRFNLKQLDQF